MLEGSISIESIEGKLVLEKTVKTKTEKVKLDVSKMSAGTYFVKINNKGELKVKKLVIE